MDYPAPDSGLVSEDDFDADAHFAWTVREIEAGRQPIPPEWEVEGPAISVSLGNACDVDPVLLAAMCGPDGLGGEAVSAAFGQDQAADVLRPSPVLAALTAQALSDPGTLNDDELIGALRAARRLANLADYQQTVAIAEFARRRTAEFEAAKARGVPAGCRAGEFPGEDLAIELVTTRQGAGAWIDTAAELTARLPRTLAGMADGTIDLGRASVIASATRSLTDADAAYADEVLAAVAPVKRTDQLARKAAVLEMKLAPEAVAARKEQAKRLDQRIEVRREASGNASLSGRELDTADVLASKAYLDAVAVQLRNSGLLDGTMGHLRALALTDLTQGRDPLDRIKPAAAETDHPHTGHTDTGQADTAAPDAVGDLVVRSGGAPSHVGASGGSLAPAAGLAKDTPEYAEPERLPGWNPSATADPGSQDRLMDEDDLPRRGPVPRGEPVPLPALINLLVPVGTLLGWSTAPAEVVGWGGLLDREETTTLVRAASRHPRTRWCVTITAPDGTAIAHACAQGRHPWKPPDPPDPPSPEPPPAPAGTPTPAQAAALTHLLAGMNVTFEPVARDACDHGGAEDRYSPGRKLRHLLRARNQTCTAPACNNHAQYCDLDHTIPYPDGPTCQCNLTPKCRRHHRAKQAPGWNTAQPAPDRTTWTTPSGRTHTTTPTGYDL